MEEVIAEFKRLSEELSDKLYYNSNETEGRRGCSDGYCYIRGPARGMHTNGGCQCIHRNMNDGELNHIRKTILQYSIFKGQIDKLVSKYEKS